MKLDCIPCLCLCLRPLTSLLTLPYLPPCLALPSSLPSLTFLLAQPYLPPCLALPSSLPYLTFLLALPYLTFLGRPTTCPTTYLQYLRLEVDIDKCVLRGRTSLWLRHFPISHGSVDRYPSEIALHCRQSLVTITKVRNSLLP